jgi:hypothetical protein
MSAVRTTKYGVRIGLPKALQMLHIDEGPMYSGGDNRGWESGGGRRTAEGGRWWLYINQQCSGVQKLFVDNMRDPCDCSGDAIIDIHRVTDHNFQVHPTFPSISSNDPYPSILVPYLQCIFSATPVFILLPVSLHDSLTALHSWGWLSKVSLSIFDWIINTGFLALVP